MCTKVDGGRRVLTLIGDMSRTEMVRCDDRFVVLKLDAGTMTTRAMMPTGKWAEVLGASGVKKYQMRHHSNNALRISVVVHYRCIEAITSVWYCGRHADLSSR